MTDEMFPLLRDLADDCVLISEEAVFATIRMLAFGNKIIAEGAGALSVAAAMQADPGDRGKTVAIVTGGSIDQSKLLSILGGSTDNELGPSTSHASSSFIVDGAQKSARPKTSAFGGDGGNRTPVQNVQQQISYRLSR